MTEHIRPLKIESCLFLFENIRVVSKVAIMSDSEDSDANLSELEDETINPAAEGDENEDEDTQLKGILNDVEETEVSWKDLVS